MLKTHSLKYVVLLLLAVGVVACSEAVDPMQSGPGLENTGATGTPDTNAAMGSVEVTITATGCDPVLGADLTVESLIAVASDGSEYPMEPVPSLSLTCDDGAAIFSGATDLPAGDYVALQLVVQSAVVRTDGGEVPFGPFASLVQVEFTVDENGETTVQLALDLASSVRPVGDRTVFEPAFQVLE